MRFRRRDVRVGFGVATAVAASALGCTDTRLQAPSAGTGAPTSMLDAVSNSTALLVDANADAAGPSYTASVEGHVVDDTGTALVDLQVTLCGAMQCLLASTDSTGRFLFSEVGAASHVLKNLVNPGADAALSATQYTHFFDFVPVAEGAEVVLPHAYVVRRVRDSVGPLSGMQTLTLDGGLEVAFDADSFETKFLATDEVHFGAVEIPKADWPSAGLADWTILRAWGTLIWDLEAPDAFHVRAPLGQAAPLPADAQVAFLVADYDYGFEHGAFVEEAATLSEDGTSLITVDGQGLDRATLWLAVTR